ncbi:hypothetical protein ACN28C_21735 [Plantactinospora sp. WMMC1484]|uniref:hypothetical protein n=1 Tax=Plantactinospora sp. WMMC1484 TaxID=3404122 RepID=UPI003BF52ED1
MTSESEQSQPARPDRESSADHDPDGASAPESGRESGRSVRSTATVVGSVLITLATLLAWFFDHQAAKLEQEAAERDRIAFQRMCDDPAAAAAMVANLPAMAALCPGGLRQLLSIPAGEVDAGPELVDAYLDRLRGLLAATLPGDDVSAYVGAIHRDDRYAAALSTLHRSARHCEAVFPTGAPTPTSRRPTGNFWDDSPRVEVVPQSSTLRTSGRPDGGTLIEVRVVDAVPSCLTRGTFEVGRPPRFVGTTALALSFSVGTGPTGQRVWLLDELTACPVRPDPLAAEPILGTYSLTKRQSIREGVADSLFAYAGSTCPG